jgi:hypothetical protein
MVASHIDANGVDDNSSGQNIREVLIQQNLVTGFSIGHNDQAIGAIDFL